MLLAQFKRNKKGLPGNFSGEPLFISSLWDFDQGSSVTAFSDEDFDFVLDEIIVGDSTLPEALHSLDEKKMTQATFSDKVEGDGIDVSSTLQHREVSVSTSEKTNQWFIKYINPNYNPPYKPGTIVKELELMEKTVFVRVYDNMPNGSGMYGSWIMRPEDIEGLTPIEIKDRFALPNIPKYVCDVELDAGTHVRSGEANAIQGWGQGGGIQYDLMGQKIGAFINERTLEVD